MDCNLCQKIWGVFEGTWCEAPPFHLVSSSNKWSSWPVGGDFKQSMKAALKSEASTTLQCWLKNFPFRTTPHATTRETLAVLFLGHQLRTRLDLRQDVEAQVTNKQAKQKENFDVHTHNREIQIGDYILAKSKSEWISGTVIQWQGPLTYLVDVGQEWIWRRHVDLLRKVTYPVVNDFPRASQDPVTTCTTDDTCIPGSKEEISTATPSAVENSSITTVSSTHLWLHLLTPLLMLSPMSLHEDIPIITEESQISIITHTCTLSREECSILSDSDVVIVCYNICGVSCCYRLVYLYHHRQYIYVSVSCCIVSCWASDIIKVHSPNSYSSMAEGILYPWLPLGSFFHRTLQCSWCLSIPLSLVPRPIFLA